MYLSSSNSLSYQINLENYENIQGYSFRASLYILARESKFFLKFYQINQKKQVKEYAENLLYGYLSLIFLLNLFKLAHVHIY